MPNIQLANNLRFLRTEMGMTQEEFRKIVNVSRQAYSNYETNKRTPDLDTLVRISLFYGISIDDLIMKPLSSPSNYLEGMAESKAAYRLSKCKKTGDTIYLTEDELDFIARFRSLSEGNRQIITGFLSNSD